MLQKVLLPRSMALTSAGTDLRLRSSSERSPNGLYDRANDSKTAAGANSLILIVVGQLRRV